MRKWTLLVFTLVTLFATAPLYALVAQPAAISGSIFDPAHAVIPAATVTLRNDNSSLTRTVISDAMGTFSFSNVPPGSYTLTVHKDGFADFRRDDLRVSAGQAVSIAVELSLNSVGQSVVVYGKIVTGATPAPTQTQVFDSDQMLRVLDRQQMNAVGPVAGAGQIISMTPGANVTGYGNSGAQKYTIMINGINQGWGGYGGFSTAGSVGVTFDGVPISDPNTDLWQSDTLPLSDLIQNVTVTYGPGNPVDRWYNNIGGSIEFTPLQPTARPQGFVAVTGGSYYQKQLTFAVSSGLHHGWSSVLAGGGDAGHDFRTGIGDNFHNPGKDFAIYSKTTKSFGLNNQDSFEFAGYYAHSGSYRSQVIPLVANPLITVSGTPGDGELYSEQTSGYYSTLPYNSYNKYDTNDMALLYSRVRVHLDPRTRLEDLAWFIRIDRNHYRTDDVYNEGPQLREWNDPYTYGVGNKLGFTTVLPMNTVNGYGYFIHSLYNSRNNFYNPADGGAKTIANAGGKVRSSYFDQDMFALSLQDDFHPIHRLHITPGIRYAGFQTNFSDHAQQDFQLAPGAVWDTNCRYNGTGSKYPNGVNDQGACPADMQNRSGIEPSVNASVRPWKWLEVYGGYAEALRTPQPGGGGGVFQSVDPASYHLERGRYGQAGFKIHADGKGLRRGLLFGLAYYHNTFDNQEIDTTLANGDSIDSSGSSLFDGVNLFLDDSPLQHLKAFVNASFESSKFTNYVTGGVSYDNLPVSYVPDATFNAGGTYDWEIRDGLHLQPTLTVQTMGSQHLFDNNNGIPSQQTMPAYTTVNFALNVPTRHFDVTFNALNLANNKYNAYEYISAGSYFGTAGYSNAPADQQAGYVLAYPGAPFTAYGTVRFHF